MLLEKEVFSRVKITCNDCCLLPSDCCRTLYCCGADLAARSRYVRPERVGDSQYTRKMTPNDCAGVILRRDGSTSRAVFDHGKARLAGRKQLRMFGMRIVLRFLIFETSWRRLIE